MEWTIERYMHRDAWDKVDWGWFRLWCLSHNLEVAAGLAAIKHLGWVSGFSAGKTIREFCGPSHTCHAGAKCDNWPECESCGPPRI